MKKYNKEKYSVKRRDGGIPGIIISGFSISDLDINEESVRKFKKARLGERPGGRIKYVIGGSLSKNK